MMMKGVTLTWFFASLWYSHGVQGGRQTCPAGLPAVVAALKANRNITLDKAFAVKNVKGIEARAKIACLRPWMKQKNSEEPFLYGVFSAKLLKKIRELLDIAAVGCYRESCAKSMLDARSKFQDLMYTVVRASNNIVKKTITIVKAHRYANRYPDKAAWVMGKHVEKRFMQNIIKEIAQLKTSASKVDSAVQVLHQNILTSTTEKRKSVERYKKLFEEMKKNKEIAEGLMKDNEKKKEKAIKLLDELEKKLDTGKRKVEKLTKEQDVYNKCEKRRRAKQQKSLKEYNEKKENLDSEMRIKSKKCMKLQRKIYSAPDETSNTTCSLLPSGASDECETRHEEARRKLYTDCNNELQQLESTEITMETAEPCTAWTKEQELFETSLDVSTLKIQVKTQKGLVALAEEKVSKDKKKKPVVPSTDMVQETKEAVQDLVVAGESTLEAKKGLCLMKTIFQELKEKPSGAVKSVVFADKNEDQVKELLVRSGFSWLAYGANVNVAIKLLEKVKEAVTDDLTLARPSREEGRRLISSAATVKRDTRQLVGEIWSKHGLTCNQE